MYLYSELIHFPVFENMQRIKHSILERGSFSETFRLIFFIFIFELSAVDEVDKLVGCECDTPSSELHVIVFVFVFWK